MIEGAIIFIACLVYVVVRIVMVHFDTIKEKSRLIEANQGLTNALDDVSLALDKANDKIAVLESQADETEIARYKNLYITYQHQMYQYKRQSEQLVQAIEQYATTISPQDAEVYTLLSVVLDMKDCDGERS